jgi:hypothetical protein
MSETTTKFGEPYRIQGQYNINDVKFDLLKIIQPYDGYMYNEKDTTKVSRMFNSYLSDLRFAHKVFNYSVQTSEKENAVTFDVQVTMQRERSAKKLKIHVGKLEYTPAKTKVGA